MSGIADGELRESQLSWGKPTIVVTILAAMMLSWIIWWASIPATDLFLERDTPAVQPDQQANTAPMENPPGQTGPGAVSAIQEWPKIAPDWYYTLVVPPMPQGEGIYNGRASATSWGSGARGTPDEMERRRIAKSIDPTITDRDAIGLSIVRHGDYPEILFAAVHVIKDMQTRAELVARGEFEEEVKLAAQEVQETHIGLSRDNGNSWIILEGPDDIDHTIVTGTPANLHLEVHPFSNPGYWKTDIAP